MTSIVQHLIPESQTPEILVTATEEMSLQDALERMIEHDFSQLPIVDKEFKLKGLVTSDSILKTVSYFKSTLDKIAVSHAALKTKTCRPDDDLSELLNGLRDASAIPIVDKSGKLVAIVTNYNTAEYYRQRAEDIMLAEDIETTLRDYVDEINSRGEKTGRRWWYVHNTSNSVRVGERVTAGRTDIGKVGRRHLHLAVTGSSRQSDPANGNRPEDVTNLTMSPLHAFWQSKNGS